ncbi:dehydration-responsive element-binding protein 1F-like [Quercus lobata]|uniref:dehydration-responsive element-binding protein 1F-like n=1 Tax=Quercus lobata TaxID=97700 RepID=UPI001247C97D|nr:dehydration-responsive element-binding protein 1F-like [Quercus lobata]
MALREGSSPTNSDIMYHQCTSHLQTQPQSGMQKRKAGRKKFQETRHPVYKGVRERNGKWVCELRQPKKKSRVWLGTWPCPDMAAKVYDVAALALKGESASLNFPEAACVLPRVKSSSSIRDIGCTATKAAQAFPCVKSSCSRNLFLDEEELFNMPRLLDSMAEGLIITPLSMQKGFNWDDLENNTMDLTLWRD